MSDEVRVVDADTGAEKGQKLERFDLIPIRPLEELARHYGRGSLKYEDRNWERGYAWSLSFAAAMRHMTQFWGGEDIDSETGTPHTIAAAWHMFSLTEYTFTHPEKDDRPKDTPDTLGPLPPAGPRMASSPNVRAYIAGPMTNKPHFNFAAFDEAATRMRAMGYIVVNPADLDRAMGFDANELPDDADWSKPPNFDVEACVKRDMLALIDCDAIYMLPGWSKSVGASAEHAVAAWKGMHIMGAEQ